MCVFCKIVSGEVPCFKIYEDEHTLAFLDRSNDFVGHTLVICKQHSTNILDCPTEVLDSVMHAVQKVSKHYKMNCGCDGVNILNNSGASAGQTVFHLHFHIIPQKADNPINVYKSQPPIERDLKTEQSYFSISSK